MAIKREVVVSIGNQSDGSFYMLNNKELELFKKVTKATDLVACTNGIKLTANMFTVFMKNLTVFKDTEYWSQSVQYIPEIELMSLDVAKRTEESVALKVRANDSESLESLSGWNSGRILRRAGLVMTPDEGSTEENLKKLAEAGYDARLSFSLFRKSVIQETTNNKFYVLFSESGEDEPIKDEDIHYVAYLEVPRRAFRKWRVPRTIQRFTEDQFKTLFI